jgi:hypothetical protein
MKRYGVDDVRAFDLLRQLSQDSNVLPNGDCPIVRNTSGRFSGLYAAPSPDELLTGIKRLAQVELHNSWHDIPVRPAHRSLSCLRAG